jgi:hypothetical protein
MHFNPRNQCQAGTVAGISSAPEKGNVCGTQVITPTPRLHSFLFVSPVPVLSASSPVFVPPHSLNSPYQRLRTEYT